MIQREQGFALVSVLWTMALLSLIAVGVLAAGGSFHKRERSGRDRAYAEALADAGLHRAILGLLDSRADARWRVDGIAREFEFAGTRITVTIQDETGRIDINAADRALLAGAFAAAGADGAATLADAVAEHRGKEVFHGVDELQLLPGITPELYAKVKPALTVHSGLPRLDPQLAPKEALLALPAMTPEDVRELLTKRATTPGTLDLAIPLDGRAFAITAELPDQRGRPGREAVVRLTGDPKRPFLTLAWR